MKTWPTPCLTGEEPGDDITALLKSSYRGCENTIKIWVVKLQFFRVCFYIILYEYNYPASKGWKVHVDGTADIPEPLPMPCDCMRCTYSMVISRISALSNFLFPWVS